MTKLIAIISGVLFLSGTVPEKYFEIKSGQIVILKSKSATTAVRGNRIVVKAL